MNHPLKCIINVLEINEEVIGMETKEYLNEEEYQQNNQKVRKTGKMLLIIGIAMMAAGVVCLVLGFLGFGSSFATGISSAQNGTLDNVGMARNTFGSMGLFAIGGFMNVIGLGITGFGAMTSLLGHRREITAYTTQQVMPIVQEGNEKMTPTAAKAAGDIAESIPRGIKEGLKDE